MEWIKTSDRLPKLHNRVLVTSSGKVYIAELTKHSNDDCLWWDISESGQTLALHKGTLKYVTQDRINDLRYSHVYYWMALPTTPSDAGHCCENT